MSVRVKRPSTKPKGSSPIGVVPWVSLICGQLIEFAEAQGGCRLASPEVWRSDFQAYLKATGGVLKR